MKITIIAAGKIQERFIEEGLSLYLKRLKHYASVNIIEVQGAKGLKEPEKLKISESNALLEKVPEGARIILLDERGDLLSSTDFAAMIEKNQVNSVKNLVFLIGGSYGFSEECYKKASGMLSLGRMTFPHQLLRLIFAEQLYRAYTILKGENYHHS